jgi:putative MFS transporter
LISSLVVPHFGWRSIFFVGLAPIVVVLFARKNVKETGRFTDLKNLFNKAKQMEETEHHDITDSEIENIETEYKVNKKEARRNTFAQLFGPEFRRTTILFNIYHVLYNYGVASVQTFLPMIIAYHKLPVENLWSVVMAATFAGMIGYFLSAALARKYPVKYIVITFGILGGLAGIPLAMATTMNGIMLWYTVWYFFSLGMWGAAPGLYTELFPTRIRGTGIGVASSTAWIGMMSVGIFMPSVITAFDYPKALLIWAGVFVFVPILFLTGIKRVPAGMELEDIAS